MWRPTQHLRAQRDKDRCQHLLITTHTDVTQKVIVRRDNVTSVLNTGNCWRYYHTVAGHIRSIWKTACDSISPMCSLQQLASYSDVKFWQKWTKTPNHFDVDLAEILRCRSLLKALFYSSSTISLLFCLHFCFTYLLPFTLVLPLFFDLKAPFCCLNGLSDGLQ